MLCGIVCALCLVCCLTRCDAVFVVRRVSSVSLCFLVLLCVVVGSVVCSFVCLFVCFFDGLFVCLFGGWLAGCCC